MRRWTTRWRWPRSTERCFTCCTRSCFTRTTPTIPPTTFPNAEEIRVRLEETAEGRMADQLEERSTGELEVVRAQRRGMSNGTGHSRVRGRDRCRHHRDEHARQARAQSRAAGKRHGGGGAAVRASGPHDSRARQRTPPTRGSRTSSSRWTSRSTLRVPWSHAMEFCRAYQARMHLLHVFEQPVTPEVYVGMTGAASDFTLVESSLREALRGVATRAGADVQTEIHVREGRAVSGILEAAKEIRRGPDRDRDARSRWAHARHARQRDGQGPSPRRMPGPDDQGIREVAARMNDDAGGDVSAGGQQGSRGLGTLDALYESTRALGLHDSLDELLAEVLERARELIGFEHAAVMLLNEETGRLSVEQLIGYGERAAEIRRASLVLGQGLSGWAAANRESVRVGDVSQDPRYVPGLAEARSNLAVPLIVGNRVAGVINVESDRLYAFTPEHEKLLTVLGTQAALGILAFQAQAQLRQRIDQLSALYRISNLASEAGALGATLNSMLEIAGEVIPQGQSAVLLLSDSRKHLRVAAGQGYQAAVRFLEIPVGQGITGRCAQTGLTQVVHDIEQLDDEDDYIPGVPGARSEVAVPSDRGRRDHWRVQRGIGGAERVQRRTRSDADGDRETGRGGDPQRPAARGDAPAGDHRRSDGPVQPAALQPAAGGERRAGRALRRAPGPGIPRCGPLQVGQRQVRPPGGGSVPAGVGAGRCARVFETAIRSRASGARSSRSSSSGPTGTWRSASRSV